MTDTPRDPLAALEWALDCLDAVDEGRSPDGGTTPSIDYQRNKAAARATLDATRPSGDDLIECPYCGLGHGHSPKCRLDRPSGDEALHCPGCDEPRCLGAVAESAALDATRPSGDEALRAALLDGMQRFAASLQREWAERTVDDRAYGRLIAEFAEVHQIARATAALREPSGSDERT